MVFRNWWPRYFQRRVLGQRIRFPVGSAREGEIVVVGSAWILGRLQEAWARALSWSSRTGLKRGRGGRAMDVALSTQIKATYTAFPTFSILLA